MVFFLFAGLALTAAKMAHSMQIFEGITLPGLPTANDTYSRPENYAMALRHQAKYLSNNFKAKSGKYLRLERFRLPTADYARD